MKILSRCLALLATLALFANCDRNSDPAPEPETEETIEETKPAAQADTPQSPALTEAAIESLIFDALSPTGEEVAVADGKKFSLDNLPEAQRKTLNDAVAKAVTKIDFNTLLTSIASNLEINGLDLKGLPGNMQANARVLTPEEAEKMGINFKNLGVKDGESGEPGSSPVSIGDVRIISISSGQNPSVPQPNPGDGDGDGDGGDSDAPSNVHILQSSTVEVTEESDPERAERFQSLLESGDSDALAGEIATLIQTGIDSATLQQAMGGGGAQSPPEK